jgi:RNA polymerase sigma-70 factor (ECF subfamily)
MVIHAALYPGESGTMRTSSESSDEELMARCALGDRDAFSVLYARMSPRVFGLARRLIIDVAQSEEVTQEVFLEVWQTAPRYDPAKGGVVSWMMTMTHRRAVDRIRASQASHNRDLKIGVRDTELSVDDVASTVETIVESERVKAALSRLTALQRQAVVLAYFKGLSHREISEALKVPTGTVKTRLRDGLIRLRDELGVTA